MKKINNHRFPVLLCGAVLGGAALLWAVTHLPMFYSPGKNEPVAADGSTGSLAIQNSIENSPEDDVVSPEKQASDSAGKENPLTCSHPSGFYSKPFSLQLASAPGQSVYYTTDGTVPAIGSPSTRRYEGPLQLPLSNAAESDSSTPDASVNNGGITGEDSVQCTHLRVLVCADEKTEAASAEQMYGLTYFIGPDVRSRYDCYVAEITGDPEDFFGFAAGVFAHTELTGPASERPAQVQMFTSDGKLLLSQNCGLRIFGNYSRRKDQKSFQLFARSAYQTRDGGNFDLSILPTRTETDGTFLSHCERLVFRNSGNDYAQAFLRDVLFQNLADQSGFPLCTPYVPAAVYINGEYQGFYWVKEPFSEQKMARIYGTAEEALSLRASKSGASASSAVLNAAADTVKTAESGFRAVTINDTYRVCVDDTEELKDDYQDLFNRFAEADFTDEDTYQELCARMDVDNFLQYYALELYLGNKDWPYNNEKAYRYVSADGTYPEGTMFDGRYRYLLYDTDYGFGLCDDVPGYSVDEDNLAVLLVNGQSQLFAHLMGREDCRSLFASYMCDLMNGAFSPENVAQTVDTLAALRDPELSRYIGDGLRYHQATRQEDGSHTTEERTVTMQEVAGHTGFLKTFAEQRPSNMRQFLYQDFAMMTPYTLQLQSDEGLQVSVGSIPQVSDGFAGQYYAECSLTLRALSLPGRRFIGWRIGDTMYSEKELTLSAADVQTLLQGGELLTVHALAEADEISGTAGPSEPAFGPTSPIAITEIHSKGSLDTITLQNLCSRDLYPEGLFLSDTADNLQLYDLSHLLLRAGESITLYGKSNVLARGDARKRLPFSLRKGETLYLSDRTGKILEKILIPDLASDDSVYRKDLFTGVFKEYRE